MTVLYVDDALTHERHHVAYSAPAVEIAGAIREIGIYPAHEIRESPDSVRMLFTGLKTADQHRAFFAMIYRALSSKFEELRHYTVEPWGP